MNTIEFTEQPKTEREFRGGDFLYNKSSQKNPFYVLMAYKCETEFNLVSLHDGRTFLATNVSKKELTTAISYWGFERIARPFVVTPCEE